MTLKRNKRPARLLPFSFLLGNRNNTNQQPIHSQFFGPPTNCSELSLLGYTLNGYYLVKPKNDATDPEIVYCAFKQPERTFNSTKLIEKRVGPLNNNSKLSVSAGIHFYVRKYTPIASTGVNFKPYIIKFDKIVLNMGGSFNESTGVFTAPKSGIYQFIFSGTFSTLNSNNKMVFIHLYLNSTVVGIATSPKNRDQDWFSFVEATLKLKRGDIIYLKPTDFFQLIVTNDGKSFDNQFCVSFSGSLLTEVDD